MGVIWNFVTSKPVRWLATVIVALLGIYGTFVFERKPDLVIEVLSDALVLDVKEKLSKLDVIYDGVRLKDTKQNLRLFVVRFSNAGTSGILKAHFDESAPLGLEISVGRILELPSVSGGEYLRQNLRPMIKGERAVLFSPVILDSGDSFEVRILVLAPELQRPTVNIVGKVAGIKSLTPIVSGVETRKASRWEEALSGDWRAQLLRGPVYFLGTMVIVVVLGIVFFIPAMWVQDSITKMRRRKRVEKYRASRKAPVSAIDEFIISGFERNAIESNVLRNLLQSGEVEIVGRHRGDSIVVTPGALIVDQGAIYEEAIKRLENGGVVLVDGPQVIVKPEVQDFAIEFFSFVDDEFTTSVKRQEAPASKEG